MKLAFEEKQIQARHSTCQTIANKDSEKEMEAIDPVLRGGLKIYYNVHGNARVNNRISCLG